MAERVYIGRDNAIRLQLTESGAAADLSGVTRMTIALGGVTVDSAVTPTAFDWTIGSGTVELKLGASLSAEWAGRARLVVYDAANPNGIVWLDTVSKPPLQVEVIA